VTRDRRRKTFQLARAAIRRTPVEGLGVKTNRRGWFRRRAVSPRFILNRTCRVSGIRGRLTLPISIMRWPTDTEKRLRSSDQRRLLRHGRCRPVPLLTRFEPPTPSLPDRSANSTKAPFCRGFGVRWPALRWSLPGAPVAPQRTVPVILLQFLRAVPQSRSTRHGSNLGRP
jgi:hypothetical protein